MTELDEDYLFPPHVFEVVEADAEELPGKEDGTGRQGVRSCENEYGIGDRAQDHAGRG